MSPTVSNLLSGLIGSVIGAAAAIWAGYQAGRQNKRLQDDDREKLVAGAMIAIRTELEELKGGYFADLRVILKSTEEGKMIQTIYKVRQNYLAVFEANCAILGLLPEVELRAIVRAYAEIKALIDTHHANSDLFDLYQKANNSAERIHFLNQLNAYSNALRSTFESAVAQVNVALMEVESSALLSKTLIKK